MGQSDNDGNKMSLEERKAHLESELESIQNELGGSWKEIKRRVKSRIDPKFWLQRYPISSVSAAFLAGILLGRGKKHRSPTTADQSGSFKNLLLTELKSIAVQRLTRAAMEQLEEKMEQRNNNK